MWEKFKEVGFTLNATGMACACLFVLWLMKTQGAAYVYENLPWVLWIEIIWAGGSILWGIERLVKDVWK